MIVRSLRQMIAPTLALGLTLCAVSAGAQSALSIDPDLNEDLRAGTVYIETRLALSGRNWSSMPSDMRARMGKMPSMSASGSGFLVSPEGHIVTNAHVIDDMNFVIQWTEEGVRSEPADRTTYLPLDPKNPKQPFTLAFTVSSIKVVLFSGEEDEIERPPKILKVDRKNDLAVLKISYNEDLPYLDLGNDKAARSGMAVIMSGFPGGAATDIAPFVDRANAERLNNRNPRASVNTGLITAIREYAKQKRYQLDIRANHGNSGGPITDFDGRVIGVLYSGIDQMQSISYAIPISNVLKILPAGLIEAGEGSEPEDAEDTGAESGEKRGLPASEGYIEVNKPRKK